MDGPAVWQGQHNKEGSIRSFARACFQYAIDTKQDLWFSTKDTIAKVYDGEFKRVFEEEFETYKAKFDELENQNVSIAGRLMSKRVMGKASFAHVLDFDGQIQVYASRDAMGEENYAAFKKLDIGDIVGVKGHVFKTKTGEISIHADHIDLLSKSLQILPEKFHGLTNTDMRYRQRYVDLIMNPESRDVFV